MATRSIISTVVLILAVNALASEPEAGANFVEGKLPVESMETLAFGPPGVLFIGDTKGSAVFAVDLGKAAIEESASPIEIAELSDQLAGLLGVEAGQVEVFDMAVRPETQYVYLLVAREDASPDETLLIRIDKEANIEEVSLESTRYSKKEITDAPAADAQLWRRSARTFTITDLAYADGELFVSGLSNEEFASSLRRIPYPFNDEMSTTGLQIYHVSHGKNETHAPIHRFLPYDLNEAKYIVAGYLCTPLVTFPVPSLKAGEKVVGKTVAELGAGNAPKGIIAYEWEGKRYILVGNNRHPLMKFTPVDIAAAEGLELPSRERGVQRKTFNEGSIAHIADYNSEYIVVINRDRESNRLHMRSISKSSL